MVLLEALLFQITPAAVLKASLCILLSCLIRWLWKRRKFYYLSMKLSGPFAMPFLGNYYQIGRAYQTKNIIEKLGEMSELYPSPFRLWSGLEFLLVVTDGDDIKIILTHKATELKDHRYELFKPVIGEGILSASGSLWKKHRKIVNPSFNRASLHSYWPIINKHALNLVNNLMEVSDTGRFVETEIYCLRCAGDIISESLFGLSMEYYKGTNDYLLRLISTITELLHERMMKFWLDYEYFYKRSENYVRHVKYMAIYREYFHTLIGEKIEESGNTRRDRPIMDSNIRTTFQTLVDAMNEGQINKQELLDEFDNINNPGTDTTYSQIGFFMMILGMHRTSQTKLRAEVEKYFKSKGSDDITEEDISPNNLPYLDMVIRELIRLFPIGPIITRTVTEDFVLTSKNVTVPKGTNVIISLYNLHRNPKYWDRPNSFIPERFTAENSKRRPANTFFPFSLGARSCIGQNMAMMLLKVIGIRLIRNFEFHSDLTLEELKLKAVISTKSAIDYKVKIYKRRQ